MLVIMIDTYPPLASGGSEIASVIVNSSLLAGFPAVCAGGKWLIRMRHTWWAIKVWMIGKFETARDCVFGIQLPRLQTSLPGIVFIEQSAIRVATECYWENVFQTEVKKSNLFKQRRTPGYLSAFYCHISWLCIYIL